MNKKLKKIILSVILVVILILISIFFGKGFTKESSIHLRDFKLSSNGRNYRISYTGWSNKKCGGTAACDKRRASVYYP